MYTVSSRICTDREKTKSKKLRISRIHPFKLFPKPGESLRIELQKLIRKEGEEKRNEICNQRCIKEQSVSP